MLNVLGGLQDCFFEELTNLGAGSPQFESGRPDQIISISYASLWRGCFVTEGLFYSLFIPHSLADETCRRLG